MTLPYENATSGEKALTEIQKILRKFNCSKFGTMIDYDKGELLVQFEWNGQQVSFPANFKGYAAAWLKDNPYTSRMRRTKQEHEQKAIDIGSVAVYSILRDWIKAQIIAVETGLLTFDEVFMPHLVLPNGQRLIEHVKNSNLLEDKGNA